MSNDFAAPVYDETATSSALDAAATVDLNDPRFAAEDIGVNPEADAFATPPPPPDAEYRAKLKQLNVKDSKGNEVQFAPWEKGDKVALFTALEARIQDPSGKYDNIPVYDRWFSTLVNRDGSTKVSTLLHKLGVTIPARHSHKVLMDLLMKALAAEPEILIETQWEASCQTCREEAKKSNSKAPRGVNGQSRFPQDSKGNSIPELICPVDAKHGAMVAQARIAGFKSIK